MNPMLTRRDFLAHSAATVVATSLWPGLTLARAETEARLVVVLLRGGLDGLAAVPAYGDGYYDSIRGTLALGKPGSEGGVLKLDGLFGLHPGLTNIHQWYEAGDASIVHAVASPYRERSHFDGQNLLENGTTRPFGAADGWLNRSLASMPVQQHSPDRELGVALGQNIPLMLRGGQPVGSWAPSMLPEVSEDTLRRIAKMYESDAFFATRLAHALETEAMAPEMKGGRGGGRFGPGQLVQMAEAAGAFLADADGPRIAMLEASGWDTHANQGANQGALAGRLGILDRSLAKLKEKLGAAWNDTVVVVVTEFGRTVAVNGTRGTDHGTATVAFVLGGSVSGGQVLADWPGLKQSALYEGRDLAPTTDMRSLFKAILAEHMGATESALETTVFPDSRKAKPLEGLVRSV